MPSKRSLEALPDQVFPSSVLVKTEFTVSTRFFCGWPSTGGSTAMAWMSELLMVLAGVSTRSQVSPQSGLRQAPPSSTPNQTSPLRTGLTQTVRMRGRFTPGAAGDEWCERHLLARIHRNTLGRLRREIEPVDVRDFVRFLCDWQRVSPATRVQGPEALAGVLAQLEGFEAAAGAWESELLPARVKDYSIAWLDDLCTAGRIAWTRLRAGGESLVRAAPIVLLPRRELTLWTRLAANQQASDEAPLSSRAQKVADCLREHGALFFDELADAARLLETELEDALAELVARGRASGDSFSGLRALLYQATLPIVSASATDAPP